MGENHFAPAPTALYGVALFAAATAYRILQQAIVAEHGDGSRLGAAVGRDLKGRGSQALYALAIPLAFIIPALSLSLYVAVTLMWLKPDRRIESALH